MLVKSEVMMDQFGFLFNIRSTKRLTAQEKMFYIEIFCRVDSNGLCATQNEEFVEFFGKDERTIQYWISNLKKKGYLKVWHQRLTNIRFLEPLTPKSDQLKEVIAGGDLQQNLTKEQSDFLKRFKELCPDKKINCQLSNYPEVDLTKLMLEIKRSPQFLQKQNNLDLKWCLMHAEEIIKGNYRQLEDSKNKSNSTGRTYSSDELNKLFQNPEDIEI